MKKFLFPITLLLVIALLTGCSTIRTLDAAEDHLEDRIEEKIEQSLPTPQLTPPPLVTDTVDANQITKEKAEEIALTHAGFTADQVKFLHTEFEIDDRVPEYSVDFFANGLEYEYEIHAESGDILSYDTDR